MAAIMLVVIAFFSLPKFLKANIYTLPEYLEYRYSSGARSLMAIYTMIIYVGVTSISGMLPLVSPVWFSTCSAHLQCLVSKWIRL